MAQTPSKEGTIPFVYAGIDVPCFTFYRVFGDVACGVPPLVVLHGGPGGGHEYLLPFADLWSHYGIPVIFYDQIGCASSTHLRHTAGDKNLWQLPVFIAQLNSVLDHFQLRDGPGYDILGQSFGGMLGADFASSRPKGLRRLVLANAPASKELGIRGWWLRRAELPSEAIQTLEEGERNEDYDSPTYKKAMAVFNKTFTCRMDPYPPELMAAMKNLSDDKTVQGTMNGPTLMVQNGSMLHWTSIPRLSQIETPTLVYNGEFDSSHDVGQIPFFEHIPRVRWVTIADGGHMCHLEDKGRKERVFKLVGEFLVSKIER